MTMGNAVYSASQYRTLLQTIFGAGYVFEQRSDETRRNLPRSEEFDVAEFAERLKALCGGGNKAA